MSDTRPNYSEYNLLCQRVEANRRLMIYDQEDKLSYAKRNSVSFEAIANLPYETWRDLRYLEALQLNETGAIRAKVTP